MHYGKDFGEAHNNIPPTLKDSKGNAMGMDVIESKYFKFLKKVA